MREDGTLLGASIMGKEPDKPLVSPKTAVNAKEGISPCIMGLLRGAQQSKSNGTIIILNVDKRINCLAVHPYGIAANI